MAKVPKISKERFLEELSLGKGVLEICRNAGLKSATTIYKWREKDEEFDEKVRACLSSPHHKARIAASQTPKDDPSTWQERYFTVLRKTKDRVRAADAAGKTITELLNKEDPDHADHDKEFADMVWDENAREALQIEDDVKRAALLQADKGMQRWLLPYLPVVGDKYKKGPRGVEEMAQQNVFIFSDEGIRAANRVLLDTFGVKEVKEVGP